MSEPELMLECMKLAVQLGLAQADKDVGSVVKNSTVLYNHAVAAGKTSGKPALSMKPKQ
jgi:hypothetical protein